ncbi:hypothetical protein K466DRAFT_139927 [Polyporus arcularius HHB13444]|uniref:Uncharacterized protein n=1 Tax=Polyporus arcularius HHB13444 TaxID=1314778 RepID=A0A5C3PEY7_9APHY|nr:hypothetical protein K466DRAFT_139927 [Polyporus arcularius HHB13444]
MHVYPLSSHPSSLIPSSMHSRIFSCILHSLRYTLPLLSSHLRCLRSCARSHDPPVISPPPWHLLLVCRLGTTRNELTDELPRSAPLRRPSRLLLALSLLLLVLPFSSLPPSLFPPSTSPPS